MALEVQVEKIVIYEGEDVAAIVEMFDQHVVEVTTIKHLCNSSGWGELSKAVSEAIELFKLEAER